MCQSFDENNYYHNKDSYLFSDSYGSSLNIFRPAKSNDLYVRVGT